VSQLKDELESQIRKLVRPLKSEEQLTEVLRKRLTKKEYKLLLGLSQSDADTTIAQGLHLDEDTYGKLKAKLTKKLNQEKLKQELIV